MVKEQTMNELFQDVCYVWYILDGDQIMSQSNMIGLCQRTSVKYLNF